MPEQMGLLVRYCQAAPGLVAAIEADPQKESFAQQLMDRYLAPARELSENGNYQESVEVYTQMLNHLKKHYN